MPTAYMLYNVTVAKEDRSPLGSPPRRKRLGDAKRHRVESFGQ